MIKISNIIKIARGEVKKNRSNVEKRVIIVMAFLSLLIYLSTSVFVNAGITTTEKYYTFYTDIDVIRDILISTGKFVEKDTADVDIQIEEIGGNLYVWPSGTDRAKAALTVFEVAVKQYNALVYGAMMDEKKYEVSLVYPLRIKLISLEREEKTLQSLISSSVERDSNRLDIERKEQEKRLAHESERSAAEDSVSENINNNVETDDMLKTADVVKKSNVTNDDVVLDVNSQNGVAESTEQVEAENSAVINSADSADKNATASENLKKQLEDETLDYAYTTDLNPYSQFKILLIVIFITMPLSMITLIFANSIMAEKINKRGIFLLLAPLKTAEIIIGKTIPYIFGSLLIILPLVYKNVSSLLDGFYAVLILLAVTITFLSIGFLVAMISRSHKELSFLGIFFISLYSCYLLIPAFMLNFSEIALASPLTIVAKLFQTEMVSMQLLIFTILPTLVAGLSLFYFGSKLFNDINMFSYRNINEKIIDSLSQIVKKRRNLFFIALSSVPFVFLIELMMIVFLLSLRNIIAIYILMFFAALVEEVFRNLGVYAIISRKLEKMNIWKMIGYSLLTGFGFFVGEKVILLIMVAEFVNAYGALILTGVILPFLLHSLLTFIFMFTASKFGKHNFGTAVLVSGMAHFLINFLISFLLGGGFK